MSENSNYHPDITQLTEKVQQSSAFVRTLMDQVDKVIIGQRYMIERIIIAMLSNGHILIEGVPGLAKTLTVTTLAKAIQASFHRLQFTPDLLPADLVGTQIYNPQKAEFYNKKGPIFANIILADEINRAPAKVQSALLEAMQERQVTIGDETMLLPKPFMVLATQNPIEQEGTYPLPEAQTDRFMLKVKVTYPTKQQEREILDLMGKTSTDFDIKPVITPDEIEQVRKLIDMIYIDDRIKDYIVNIVDATRHPADYGLQIADLIAFGASPRATISLTLAARACAFMAGRAFVTPQDIKNIGPDVLRHRVIVSYEAEAEDKTSDDIIKTIFDNIEVP